MGTQIGELVAAKRSEKIKALALLTPIPLAGTPMPSEMSDGMKALQGAPIEDQRAGRLGLGPHLPTEELERLLTAGAAVPAATVSDVLDVWYHSDPRGQEASRYTGPVLILPGEQDPFAAAKVIAAGVTVRFTDARVVPVPKAGHWPHAELMISRTASVARVVDPGCGVTTP